MTKDLQKPGTALWDRLRGHTLARIGLARTGSAVTTEEHLAFQLAHARARDAVYDDLDVAALMSGLTARHLPALALHSAAADRRGYLLRPDLGRRLDPASRTQLAASKEACDLALVVADGLSARAVERHALPLLDAVLPHLRDGWTLSAISVVTLGRVAIGDDIGAALNAKLVACLIGERPGLSSPDSLGVYVTWNPHVGCKDAARNCISNIRPEGLGYTAAAAKFLYLLNEARRRGLTGVLLKDETGAPLLPPQ